jgi:hypothetical protein
VLNYLPTRCLFSALLAVVVIVFCCLSTSAGLPLQDARLEQIDKWLGFNWIAFVEFANSSALASWLLLKAYQSTAVVLIGTMLWFCISGQGGRLAELLGLLCVTSIGIAIGMMILPAAGAYSHYQPLLSATKISARGRGCGTTKQGVRRYRLATCGNVGMVNA